MSARRASARSDMYIIIWEFHARLGSESAFERAYGPDGEWARLFARGEGFLGTELIRDESAANRYLTIDRWESPAAFEDFQAKWAEEYHALDRRCEGLTEEESLIVSGVVSDGEATQSFQRQNY